MDYPKSDSSVGLINGKFSDGNPSAGVPASRDPARHMNAVTDEVLHVITSAGLTPAENNLTQLLEAIARLAAAEAVLDTAGLLRIPVRALPAGELGYLIIQWLRPSPNFSGGATPTVNWPEPFPSACLFALAADYGATNNYLTTFDWTSTGLKLRSSQTASGDAVAVLGIGY